MQSAVHVGIESWSRRPHDAHLKYRVSAPCSKHKSAAIAITTSVNHTIQCLRGLNGRFIGSPPCLFPPAYGFSYVVSTRAPSFSGACERGSGYHRRMSRALVPRAWGHLDYGIGKLRSAEPSSTPGRASRKASFPTRSSWLRPYESELLCDHGVKHPRGKKSGQ